MGAIQFPTVENAIQAWVSGASGIPGNRVIWNLQPGDRPPAPYITLALTDLAGVGHDRVLKDDAPDPEPGEEVRLRAVGHRTARLSMQCFAADGSATSALSTLADVIGAIEIYADALDVAGVGIGDVTPVQSLEGRRGGILEPRAVCDVTIHLGSEVEARTTYVETIDLTVSETDLGDIAELELDLGVVP